MWVKLRLTDGSMKRLRMRKADVEEILARFHPRCFRGQKLRLCLDVGNKCEICRLGRQLPGVRGEKIYCYQLGFQEVWQSPKNMRNFRRRIRCAVKKAEGKDE